MVGRWLPWVGVLALYVAAVLVLGADDPAPLVPPVLERLEDAIGRDAVELCLAGLAALAFGLGAAVARRIVPEPWATRGVLIVALSPLGFAMSSGVRAGAIAAAMLAGGAVLALRTRDGATRLNAGGAAFLLSFAPWFGLPYMAAAIPMLFALMRWTYRQRRPLLTFIELEIAAASVVALVGVEAPRGVAATPGDGPERVAAVLVDTSVGVLRWAPFLLLVAGAAYLYGRSRKEKLARALPTARDVEAAAALAGVATLGLFVVATCSTVTPSAGLPFAAALAAWAFRRFPRAGALLGTLTLAMTAWVLVDLAGDNTAGWLGPDGPLSDLFPAF